MPTPPTTGISADTRPWWVGVGSVGGAATFSGSLGTGDGYARGGRWKALGSAGRSFIGSGRIPARVSGDAMHKGVRPKATPGTSIARTSSHRQTIREECDALPEGNPRAAAVDCDAAQRGSGQHRVDPERPEDAGLCAAGRVGRRRSG